MTVQEAAKMTGPELHIFWNEAVWRWYPVLRYKYQCGHVDFTSDVGSSFLIEHVVEMLDRMYPGQPFRIGHAQGV